MLDMYVGTTILFLYLPIIYIYIFLQNIIVFDMNLDYPSNMYTI